MRISDPTDNEHELIHVHGYCSSFCEIYDDEDPRDGMPDHDPYCESRSLAVDVDHRHDLHDPRNPQATHRTPSSVNVRSVRRYLHGWQPANEVRRRDRDFVQLTFNPQLHHTWPGMLGSGDSQQIEFLLDRGAARSLARYLEHAADVADALIGTRGVAL